MDHADHVALIRGGVEGVGPRWLELGAVSGVMRTQANGYSFRNDRELRSEVWSPKVLPVWRRYAKLRTQLYPYLRVASDRYQRDGMPLVRQLSLVWPGDRSAASRYHRPAATGGPARATASERLVSDRPRSRSRAAVARPRCAPAPPSLARSAANIWAQGVMSLGLRVT